MIAVIDSRVVTALVVVGGLAVFGLLLLITGAGELRGRRKAKVPPSMRPGHSDEDLESKVLPRYLLWAGIATLFMAVWIPVYWMREPNREAQARVKFQSAAVDAGGTLFSTLCAQCHGDRAQGQPRQVTFDGKQLTYAEPPLKYIYDRYLKAGRNQDEITQILYDAINRGRPGTPMPTWGLAFGGPLNTAQVDDVVAFLQFIQTYFPQPTITNGEQLFLANCAVCHNSPEQQAAMTKNPALVSTLAGLGGVGPNLTVELLRQPAYCPGEDVNNQQCANSVYQTIAHGRLNSNRPSMPAWAALGNDAVKALVEFIKSIQRG